MSLYGLDIARENTDFTFRPLLNAPKYSIKAGTYLGALANSTFEGDPWEVMKANKLIYNFVTKKVVPISSISQRVELNKGLNYFFSDGLLLPGSLMDDGTRVTDYSAGYSFRTGKFKYTEVTLG